MCWFIHPFRIAIASFALAAALAPAPRAAEVADPVSAYNAVLQNVAELEAEGKVDEAAAEARQLVNLLPDHADGYFYFARLLRETADFPGAVLQYQRGFFLDSARQPQAFWNIAYTYVKWSERLERQGDLPGALRQLEQAIAILERLAIAPDIQALRDVDPEATLLDRRRQRQILLRRLRDDDKAGAKAAIARADTYRQRGMLPHAQRELLNAIALDPDSAESWNELAKCYAAEKNHTQAVEACRRAIDIDPQFKSAYNSLGVNEDERGRFVSAVAAFEQALVIDPHYTLAMTNLGLTHQRTGEAEKARACYTRALEMDPENTVARLNLASLDLAAHRHRDAIAHCDRLLRAAPFDIDARLLKADVCRALGRFDEAVALNHQALLIDPNRVDVRQALTELAAERDRAAVQSYVEEEPTPARPAVPAMD